MTTARPPAAWMGTAPAGREGSVQERSTAFRLWSVPCDPGWVCGIEVVGSKLHYFCAIFASSNELRLPPGGNGSKKLTVSLPFLDRNGGGCPANPC